MLEQKEFSEETAKQIDSEVRRIVEEAYNRATKLLTDNKSNLDKLAKALVEKEAMNIIEVKELLGIKDSSSEEQTEETK